LTRRRSTGSSARIEEVVIDEAVTIAQHYKTTLSERFGRDDQIVRWCRDEQTCANVLRHLAPSI
jgi:hypothetical protein